MRRRMLMDLISRGDGVIKYGYFDIKPEIEAESWQVNITDFKVEVHTNLKSTPKKLLCVYMDDKETFGSNGAALFIGNVAGNGCCMTSNNVRGKFQGVSFLSPDALYTRYDESTSILYVHVVQWDYVKCGKWMWIAIYDE